MAAEDVALAVVLLAGRALLARRRRVVDHLARRVLRHQVVAEQQPRGADGDQVAVAQPALAHAVAVDERSVGRVAVAQEVLAAAVLDHGVAARHHGVGQHHVVGRIAPDRQQRAAERDLPA
jgi:hypothetical protein